MSTLAEIERAIASLPPEQWAEIRQWMDRHTPKVASREAVDWTRSAAVTRERAAATRLPAETVMEALATVRE